MLRRSLPFIVFLILLSTSQASFALRSLTVKPESSVLEWTGKKRLKTFGEHTGRVQIQDGTVHLNDLGEISSAELTVNMMTITNEDLEGKWKEKLLQHLYSEEFFHVEKFRTASFKTNKVQKLLNNNYKLEGLINIKGTTQPMTITGKYAQIEGKHSFIGKMDFDRSQFGIQYGSKKGGLFDGLGNNIIHNLVDLSFTIFAE